MMPSKTVKDALSMRKVWHFIYIKSYHRQRKLPFFTPIVGTSTGGRKHVSCIFLRKNIDN